MRLARWMKPMKVKLLRASWKNRVNKKFFYDPKIKIGRIPPLLQEEKSKNEQAA
jgi:hypothetical protein